MNKNAEDKRLFAFFNAKRLAPHTSTVSRRSAKHPSVGMKFLKGAREVHEIGLESQPFQRKQY